MKMSGQKALLLNASNMDKYAVYPYAFIQVPAVARRAGVDVICKDLLGVPRDRWEGTLQALIARHDPAMILITLRNVDSGDSGDYEWDGSKPYFPVEQTKELIAAIRAGSDLKIALGGFGFSILPEEIMHYLRPDLGVFGGPDAFFAHFEDVQTGRLGEVANLLYFEKDQLISNPRIFYPPLADTEYTPQTIEDMMAFYDSFPSPGFEGAPVEVMRGCCQSCVFCSEPHVAGKRVRYRDLSAVMGDIEILVDHGITRLYMISSELNPQGNDFVLELADRIRSVNERQTEDRKVAWYGANYLLSFSMDEFELLYKSGFTGGWFDVTALDDENARAMRTPYRNASLLTHLKTYAQLERKQFDQIQAQDASPSTAHGSEDNANHKDGDVNWSLFLGNPATTTRTLRNTLRVANREGLAQLFDGCYINTNIRVFDYERPDEATLAVTYSVTADLERTDYQQLLPSFAYPPALLQDFGSEKHTAMMFDHIAETYLSTEYLKTRDWRSFLREKAAPASIAGWMAELSHMRGVHVPAPIRPTAKGKAPTLLQQLFLDEPGLEERDNPENLARQTVESLLSVCLEAFPELFGSLALPTTMDRLEQTTTYDLAVAVFDRWCTEKELVDELAERTKSVLSDSTQALIRFCVQAMLYKLNVLIKPEFRALFVEESSGETSSQGG
jgi:hypothetical protein